MGDFHAREEDRRRRLSAVLNRKFAEWAAGVATDGGGPPSKYNQKEFSKWLGMGQSDISRILAGEKLPSLENIFRLAGKLGPEIYDALDMPRMVPPDDFLRRFVDYFYLFPDEIKEEFYEMAQRWEREAGIKPDKKNTKPDTPKTSNR